MLCAGEWSCNERRRAWDHPPRRDPLPKVGPGRSNFDAMSYRISIFAQRIVDIVPRRVRIFSERDHKQNDPRNNASLAKLFLLLLPEAEFRVKPLGYCFATQAISLNSELHQGMFRMILRIVVYYREKHGHDCTNGSLPSDRRGERT